MEAISFDTSGAVVIMTRRDLLANGVPAEPDERIIRWPDLSPFVQGYVEALFESLCDPASRGWVWVPAFEQYRKPLLEPASDAEEAWWLDTVLDEFPAFSDLDPSALALILRDCEELEAGFRAIGIEPDARLGRDSWTVRQTGAFPDKPPRQPYLSDEGRVCLREVA